MFSSGFGTAPAKSLSLRVSRLDGCQPASDQDGAASQQVNSFTRYDEFWPRINRDAGKASPEREHGSAQSADHALLFQPTHGC